MICMEVDGMKRVLFKVILPLAFIVVWLDMCYWICLGDNGMNWFQFWIMCGFPFGIQKMLVLLMLDAYPSLQNMYSADDENTEVFYFKNATATFSAFTHEPEVVKF